MYNDDDEDLELKLRLNCLNGSEEDSSQPI